MTRWIIDNISQIPVPKPPDLSAVKPSGDDKDVSIQFLIVRGRELPDLFDFNMTGLNRHIISHIGDRICLDGTSEYLKWLLWMKLKFEFQVYHDGILLKFISKQYQIVKGNIVCPFSIFQLPPNQSYHCCNSLDALLWITVVFTVRIFVIAMFIFGASMFIPLTQYNFIVVECWLMKLILLMKVCQKRLNFEDEVCKLYRYTVEWCIKSTLVPLLAKCS